MISAACKSSEIEGAAALAESVILFLRSSSSVELTELKSGFLFTVTNLFVSNFSSPFLALKVMANSLESSSAGS